MSNPNPDVSINLDSSRSASVTVQHTARTMKFYNVTEYEMKSLSLLNTLQSVGVAGGTLFLGAACPELFNAVFPKAGTPPADWRQITLGLVLSAMGFAFAFMMRSKRKEIWADIGEGTR